MFVIKPVYKIQDLQYCHSSGVHPLQETGICIPPKYRNRKKLWINADLPDNYGSAETLIEELRMQTRKAEDLISLLLFTGKQGKAKKHYFMIR